MTEVEVKKTQESLQDRLAQVIELLQRQRVVEERPPGDLDERLRPAAGKLAHAGAEAGGEDHRARDQDLDNQSDAIINIIFVINCPHHHQDGGTKHIDIRINN